MKYSILDGLEMRAESWEKTAEYLRNERMTDDQFLSVEECSKPEEAEDIAKHYRSIIQKIRIQMEAQE